MAEPAQVPLPPPAEPRQRPRDGWFFNPYVHVALSTLLAACYQVLYKLGSSAVDPNAWLGVAALRSGWTWLGIFATLASLASWLYALRFVPLNIAFNLTAAMQALVPIGAWIVFRESISLQRGIGIALVLAGVALVAQTAGEAEEKL